MYINIYCLDKKTLIPQEMYMYLSHILQKEAFPAAVHASVWRSVITVKHHGFSSYDPSTISSYAGKSHNMLEQFSSAHFHTTSTIVNVMQVSVLFHS